MTEQTTQTDLAVIGGGPGGYAAAFLAADRGLSVALIDPREHPGGVCLYEGCIPSKTLLHVARLIHEVETAGEWGLGVSKPEIDLDRLRARKNEVVAQLTSGLGRLSSQRNVRYISAKAAFTDGSALLVTPNAGGERTTLSFKNAVIATGSVPVTLPGIEPDDGGRVVDSGRALALEDIPGSLLVVGGGYIGLELGTVYAALGSRVTVVEMTPGLLPGADRDLVGVVKKNLERRFESIALNTRVTGVEIEGNGVEVSLQGADGAEERRRFDKVLVAVGRRPNSRGLGLDRAGVEIDDRGFVKVDLQRRTTAPNIFAVGDVTGEPMLAHKASHEARTAVEVICGKKAAFEPATIPAVVFTDPELAWAGWTEKKARESRIDCQVMRFPWAASGRATAVGRTDGLTKLIVETETRRILGVGIAGIGAGEMIAEGVLALEMGANAEDLKLSIHPHPTLSETVMEAAELFFGTATHMVRPKRNR